MSRLRTLIHSTVSVLFFAVGFLGLGYMVMTTSSAQTVPYVDMGAFGGSVSVSGSTYTTPDSDIDIFWLISGLTSCELRNQNTNTVVGTYTHTSAQYGGGVPAEIVNVSAPLFSGPSTSIAYTISCATTNNTTVVDSITVRFTQLNVIPGVTPISATQTATTITASPGATATLQNTPITPFTPVNETQPDPGLTSGTTLVSNATISQVAQGPNTGTVATAPNINNAVLQGPNTVISNPGVTVPVATPGTLTNHDIDLAINGQLQNSQGGAISLGNIHSFILSWTAQDVSTCRIKNTTTGASQFTQVYAATPVDVVDNGTFVGNASSQVDYTYTYELTCYDFSNNNLGSDTVTVSVDVPFDDNSGSSCQVEIDNFDVDQDDVYGDESDDDVSLSWNSSSSGMCTHSCRLTYEGDEYLVSDDDNDYDVYDISSDHTFVLECYENGNPSNNVTSTEHVDYSSNGGSNSNNDDPSLETLSAQQVGSSTVRLRGTYDDGDCSSLKTGFTFGTSTSNMSLMNGYTNRNGSGTVTLQLQGLTAGTTYYYKFVESGCSGNHDGNIKSFKTTGSNYSYQPYQPPITTGYTSTTTNSQSGTQQIVVQEIDEDGTIGEVQYNDLNIGVGYVPESTSPTRASKGFPTWLMVIGLLILLGVAGKFIHEAFSHPHDSQMPRY